MKLHIGGEAQKDGWKILNIQKKEGVDFIGDISNLDQFDNESIEEIYSSHTLEHVRRKDILNTLKGINRVLKKGGKFYVSVPDLSILCHTFINPTAPPEVKFHVMGMMFGGQIDDFDYHYAGWTQEFLFDYLGQAGFSEGKRVETFGLFNDTSDYRPYGFPISLNVIAIK